MKRHLLVSSVGTNLDAGKGPDRWSRWRPTVGLHQHEDLLIGKTVLLYGRRHQKLAELLAADINRISPETETKLVLLDPRDPWDFEEVYEGLLDFAKGEAFDLSADDILLHLTTGTHVFQICAFLLAEARYIPAKLIQSSPPPKKHPICGRYSIIDLDLSRYDRLAHRFEDERSKATSFLRGGVNTKNIAYGEMIDRMERVAVGSTAPVLLLGPTGAGKSLLARRLYDLKKLKHQVEGAFIELNCATVRGEHALPMIFGQKRGWNGSATERKGLLRAAAKGVLFLDEIEALGLDDQAMLLNAIETGRFYPLGADQWAESRFQLIAATSANLSKLVSNGQFRADLYARLNLWTFELPPLRDRRDDIESNLDHELSRAMREAGERIAFAADARRSYLKFAEDPLSTWNGNFRDLAASATRMVTLAERGRISKSTVQLEIDSLKKLWREGARDEDFSLVAEVVDHALEIDRFDLVQLAEVIRICRASNSLSDAGRKLFAASRKKKSSGNDADRLSKFLARYGLKFSDISSQI